MNILTYKSQKKILFYFPKYLINYPIKIARLNKLESYFFRENILLDGKGFKNPNLDFMDFISLKKSKFFFK